MPFSRSDTGCQKLCSPAAFHGFRPFFCPLLAQPPALKIIVLLAADPAYVMWAIASPEHRNSEHRLSQSLVAADLSHLQKTDGDHSKSIVKEITNLSGLNVKSKDSCVFDDCRLSLKIETALAGIL